MEEDEWEKRHREVRRKHMMYYLFIALSIIGLACYFGYTLYQMFDNNKFCSLQDDGIHVYKGNFMFCKEGNSAVLKDYKTYTKALCNTTNYCIDALIYCNGEVLIDIVPMGEGVQFGEDWVDIRPSEVRWKWCEDG